MFSAASDDHCSESGSSESGSSESGRGSASEDEREVTGVPQIDEECKAKTTHDGEVEREVEAETNHEGELFSEFPRLEVPPLQGSSPPPSGGTLIWSMPEKACPLLTTNAVRR